MSEFEHLAEVTPVAPYGVPRHFWPVPSRPTVRLKYPGKAQVWTVENGSGLSFSGDRDSAFQFAHRLARQRLEFYRWMQARGMPAAPKKISADLITKGAA